MSYIFYHRYVCCDHNYPKNITYIQYTAHLDPRFVPEKYHKFLNPSVRRIYLDTPDASDTEREHVAQIKMLEQRVMGLQQDKLRLMGRCEAAIASSRKHQEGEHTATFEVQKLRRMYTTLTVKYGELKTKHDQAKGKNKEVRAGSVLHLFLSSNPSHSVHQYPELLSICREGLEKKE